jgi:hypothetical protein
VLAVIEIASTEHEHGRLLVTIDELAHGFAAG